MFEKPWTRLYNGKEQTQKLSIHQGQLNERERGNPKANNLEFGKRKKKRRREVAEGMEVELARTN